MTVTQFALATGLSWPERFSTAGSVTLLGMLAIFCVLAVLWATIEIMHAVLNKGHKQSKQPKQPKQPKEKKEPKKTAKEKPSQNNTPVPNEQDAAVAAAIAASLAAYEDGGATVAAIIAAITAARAEEGDTGTFRVVSFKRAETAGRRRRF